MKIEWLETDRELSWYSALREACVCWNDDAMCALCRQAENIDMRTYMRPIPRTTR